MGLEDEARRVLETYGGLDETRARELVTAVVEAAKQEALEAIAGHGPQPTAIAEARALRLRQICEKAHRSLTQREIELIFRVTSAGASALSRRMQASYPLSVDQFIQDVVSSFGIASKTGKPGNLRYDIYFEVPEAVDYAIQLLRRRGMHRDLRKRTADQVVDVPRGMTDSSGKLRDPLDVLSIQKP